MIVAEIELYKILKTKFTEREAENIISGLEQKVNTTFEARKNEFSTKGDILTLKEDISRLEIKIAETKVDLIKWVFTFFAAIAVMIIGLYLKK